MELGGGILIGLLLGSLFVWLLSKARTASIATRLDEKEQSVAALSAELRAATTEKSDLKAELSGEVAAREQERLASE